MGITMILDIIAGFLCAALAAMGVGGGGILVIYLTMLRGMDQKAAQGINLMFFICSVIASLVFHLKKRKLEPATVLAFSVSGCIGAYLGSRLAGAVSAELLKKIFGWFLIASASITLGLMLKEQVGAVRSKRNSENLSGRGNKFRKSP